jgi:benzoyl-CoA reductase/2-hydroxyglutaryl-CoA dehydratase subunit BcrC/BadD/HgdB
LCQYTRRSSQKGVKYSLFRSIEFFCPVCRLANLDRVREKLDKEISKDFERRYQRQFLLKKDKKIEKNLARRVQENLQHLRKNSHRPSGITYYENLLSSSLRIDELKRAKEKGKKIIGTFCNFVPEELIYASEAIPIRLCAGSYDTISPAEEILPRDLCPLIKSALGFKLLRLSYFELCDLVIVPTTCDGKKKLGEILADFLPVWILEVPHRKNIQTAQDLWIQEIKRLKGKLEQFTTVKISGERLKQAIELLHKRQTVFRELYQLKKYQPPFINGRDSLLVIQASFYDDIKRWIQKTQELCEEVKHQILDSNLLVQNRKTQIPRLLLTGAPIIWPNYKVLNIIEEAGAIVVADELCSGTQSLYQPVEVDEWTEERMLQAVANRYLLPSTCPCFTECNDRIDRILQMAKDFSVGGVVYHSLRLCQLYDLEADKVRRVLREKRIPMLNLHTDYAQEDVEQIKTRLEAFLEMIRERREKI